MSAPTNTSRPPAQICTTVAQSLYGAETEWPPKPERPQRLPAMHRLAPLSENTEKPVRRAVSAKSVRILSNAPTPITPGQALRVGVVLAIGLLLMPLTHASAAKAPAVSAASASADQAG